MSISDADEEEPRCAGEFPGADASRCCFGSSHGSGVECAGVGEDDGDEGCKIKAWRGRNPSPSLAEVWEWQQWDCSGF